MQRERVVSFPDGLLSHLVVSPSTTPGHGQAFLLAALDRASASVVVLRGAAPASAGLLPAFIPAHVCVAEGLEQAQTFPLTFPARASEVRGCFFPRGGGVGAGVGVVMLDAWLEEVGV